jgi:hypothetical protein
MIPEAAIIERCARAAVTAMGDWSATDGPSWSATCALAVIRELAECELTLAMLAACHNDPDDFAAMLRALVEAAGRG